MCLNNKHEKPSEWVGTLCKDIRYSYRKHQKEIVMSRFFTVLSFVTATLSIAAFAKAEAFDPEALVGAYRLADSSCFKRPLLGNSDVSPADLPFLIYPAKVNNTNNKGVVLGGYYFKEVFYAENTEQQSGGSTVVNSYEANKLKRCNSALEFFAIIPIVTHSCRSVGLNNDGTTFYNEKIYLEQTAKCQLVKMPDQSASGLAKALILSRANSEMSESIVEYMVEKYNNPSATPEVQEDIRGAITLIDTFLKKRFPGLKPDFLKKYLDLVGPPTQNQ